MKVQSTAIAGLMVVDQQVHVDSRGAFARWFCERELASLLAGRHIVQVNYSRTDEVGAIRGLHFQHAPYAEMKLVRCLRGAVCDLVVDLRAGSPTFLAWHAEELSSGTGRMLVVPEGLAHGFQVLQPGSELLYLHTAAFAAAAEGGVRYDDPRLGIRWPLPATDLSARDRSLPALDPHFSGLIL